MKNSYKWLISYLEPVRESILQIFSYQDIFGNAKAIVILENNAQDKLLELSSLGKYTRNKDIAIPLIVTRSFVTQSLDSYPLEFIDITSSVGENIVLNEDLFATLSFDRNDVRLQMEREFKSKWLHTQQLFFEGKQKPKELSRLLRFSITSLVPALKGFFFLSSQPYPQDLNSFFEHAALISNADLGVFSNWQNNKEAELADITRYLRILQKLSDIMEDYPI